jgi:hypothetical protein
VAILDESLDALPDDRRQLRPLRKRLRDSNHPVSITVCFDDGEELGRPDPFAHYFRVVAQCASIDFRPAAIRAGFHRPIVRRVAGFAMVV